MITNYGFIFLSPGADPARDRHVMRIGDQQTTLVAIPQPQAGVAVAAELARNGAQLIELCGAFSPAVTADVTQAAGADVVVGVVGYDGAAASRLAALTADEGGGGPE